MIRRRVRNVLTLSAATLAVAMAGAAPPAGDPGTPAVRGALVRPVPLAPIRSVTPAARRPKVAPAAVSSPLPLPTSLLTGPRFSFLEEQLRHARVRAAREEKDALVRTAFEARGLTYPSRDVFLRAFKRDRTLELWARNPGAAEYTLVKSYPICTLGSSGLGPKRRAGDEQVPEGLYTISAFNPESEYHLALGIDYPNRADRIRNGAVPLGGSIMIHGGCRTVGCLPMTDESIEELYWVVVAARAAGQHEIPVHIFPTRLDDTTFTQLRTAFAGRLDVVAFWANLKQAYDFFEQSHTVPVVRVDDDGEYRIRG